MTCVGKLLEGRYELEAQLGEGGTAVVFRARDLVTKASVAIKLMEPNLEEDDEAVAYFCQEGRLAARIRDPHLVPALHFGVDEGRHFIVYDYLPGSSTLDALAELGRVAPHRVCGMVLQVLYALDTLHRANVVHGDVSLNNCLWRERDGGRDEVRLCDLGCAWARSSVVTGGPTTASDRRGSAYYTAPELLNSEAGDHRADLWSVGAVMYRLMTTRDIELGDPEEPFGIPPPALLLPTIPQSISDVVMRALATVDQRYPSAAAMIEAIRAVLAVPPARRGVPLWASIAGMGLAASFATFASLASMANAGDASALAADECAPKPAATSVSVRAQTEVVPESITVEPSRHEPIAVAPSEPPKPSAAPRPLPAAGPSKPAVSRPVALTWATVERVVMGKAAALRRCSRDEFISLGLRVVDGQAKLETLDGVPVSLPRDRCAHDVVSGLRFAKGAAIAGVVGVNLPDLTQK